MSKFMVLALLFISTACSTFTGPNASEKNPGYRFGKQLDDTALRSSFLER